MARRAAAGFAEPDPCELDQLSHYDAKAMEAFQRRVAYNDEVEHKLKVGGPAHLKDRQAHDEAVAGFRQNCSGAFAAAILSASKPNSA
jgi:hypothetical protein